jgi:subtilisin family serine protease
MNRKSPTAVRAATLVSALAFAACADQPTAPLPAGADLAASQAPIYLVTFRDGVTDVAGTAREIARENGFALRFVREHAARGFSAVVPPARLAALRADPRILLVEPDGPVSLIEPIRSEARPGGGGSGESVPWGIARVGGAGDGTGKTAWIIDSGIDLDHPDLNTSRSCHTYFAGTSPDDQNGHGTHVAGTIAAIGGNGIGVVGVAAGAYVCSVRVLGASGSGSWEGVVNGVNHVAANGASGDVANMSLGGSGSNSTLERAIQDAAARGIAFTIAAGNDGDDANNHTPARVNGTNIYTISAINSSGCMPSWSNYGNPPVDYAAPGVSVLSTYKGGGTRTLSGTSMAAPHVAGILLLGGIRTSGFATCDPDGNPDPIASR